MEQPMTHTFTIDARFVAEHETFLRRLARGLVGDGAEDAVQDAWLDALQAPPRRDPRGYLATILRHGALRLRRRERQRAGVEATAARGERLEDVVARRLAVQEELARALRALPDAQRTALYLRYHEDLTPTAIAARTDTSVGTVKTRLTRGLAALRADLEARADGDGRAWLAALAPLATGSERRVASASHWLSLSAAATIGVVALAALASELLTTRAFRSEPARRTEARAEVASIGAGREPVSTAAPIGRPPARTLPALGAARTAQQSAVAGPLDLGLCEVSLELVDSNGVPVVGAEARFVSEASADPVDPFGYRVEPLPTPVTAFTDTSGRCQVTLTAHPLIAWSLTVRSASHGHVLERLLAVEPGVAVDLGRLVAEPAATLVVTITQPDGSPAPSEVRACLRLDELAGPERFHGALHELFPLTGGSAVFEGLPAGRYQVTARDPMSASSAWHPVVVAAGEAAELTFALDGAPRFDLVRAHASGPFRARPPIGALRLSTSTGVALVAEPRSNEVPSELWEVPGEGPFVLEFEAPGWRAVRRDDVARGDVVSLDVEPLSGVRLYVEDTSGAPIVSGVSVGRKREVDGPRGPRTQIEPMHLHRVPLASGTFFPLPHGDERLSVGGPWWNDVEVEVAGLALAEVRDVHVTLAPARRIRGRVVDDRGAPVPFARIQLLEPAVTNDGPTTRIALMSSSHSELPEVRHERDFRFADAAGSFEIGSEIAGALLLRAWYADAFPRGSAGLPASFDARQQDTQRLQGVERAVPTDRGVGGEVFEVELELAARVAVAGRIAIWTPAMGGFDLVLVARHGGGPPSPVAPEHGASCTLDAEGRFVFERIAPGRYGLHARFGVQPFPMTGVRRATPLLMELDVPVAGLTDLEVTPLCVLPELVPIEIESVGDLHGPLVVRAVELDAAGDEIDTTARWIRIEPGQSAHLPLEAAGRWRLSVVDHRDYWSLIQEVDRDTPCAVIPLRLDLAVGRVRLVDLHGAPVAERPITPVRDRLEVRAGPFAPIRRSNGDGVIELCLPRGPVRLTGGALDWPPLPGTTLVVQRW
jgi:RNA polymerase sigma factor (sigma-70 family)